MAFTRRRFPRRRFSRFARRRATADVQTLSLCNVPLVLNTSDAAFTCQDPFINWIPIMTSSVAESLSTSPFVLQGSSFRGLSFRGAAYKYKWYTGAHDGTGGNATLAFVDQIHMYWVKGAVNPEFPLTPLFTPNLIFGGPVSAVVPYGDPACDILHRDIVDVVVPPPFSCTEDANPCAALAVWDAPSPVSIYDELWKQTSRPYHSARVRSRRFLKENEALWLAIEVVSGAPQGLTHQLTLNLEGHLALKLAP